MVVKTLEIDIALSFIFVYTDIRNLKRTSHPFPDVFGHAGRTAGVGVGRREALVFRCTAAKFAVRVDESLRFGIVGELEQEKVDAG